MKNRKVIVTAFLLVAVMILGVGYAAVYDDLNFSGDALLSTDQVQHEFDADVKIVAVSEDNSDWHAYNATEAEINLADDLEVDIMGSGDNEQDIVDFQIYNLTDKDDYQVIWFKVENASAHAASLAKSEITESGSLVGADYFTAVYEIYETDGTTVTDTLPANGTVLVKLTVTLKDTPADTYKANFSFSINASAQ